MPHGPAHAVLVALNAATHASSSFGGGGITSDSVWPDSARVMSGAGPCSVITHGVWQSWHAEVLTMYLPRATLAASGVAAGASVAVACGSAAATGSRAASATRAVATTTTPVMIAGRTRRLVCLFMGGLLGGGKGGDPCLDQFDAERVDVLRAQRRHPPVRIARAHAQRQYAAAGRARLDPARGVRYVGDAGAAVGDERCGARNRVRCDPLLQVQIHRHADVGRVVAVRAVAVQVTERGALLRRG